MFIDVGVFSWSVFAVVVIITLFVVMIVLRNVKDYRFRWVLLALIGSIFLYSGIGIAFTGVNNMYLAYYGIFLLCFILPSIVVKESVSNKDFSSIDLFFLKHYRIIKWIAYFYLFLLLLPSIYPEFRLFQPFEVRDMFWETKEKLATDPVTNIASVISMLIKPFAYAYIVCYTCKYPKGRKHLIYFGLIILLSFIQLHYLARNQMVVFAADFLILAFCLKGNKIIIKKKYIVVFALLVAAAIPFFYAYSFIRMGHSFDETSLSFTDMAGLLFSEEFCFPKFYDEIISNTAGYKDLSILGYIAYIMFLPIPSFVWGGKPSIEFASLFTYNTIGLSSGDTGYYVLLPSAMGESLMVGGLGFFWLFALITGLVVAVMTKYISKHTTLIYYFFCLIVQFATYGRGGTAGLMPTLINGLLGVFILDIFLSSRKRKTKQQ